MQSADCIFTVSKKPSVHIKCFRYLKTPLPTAEFLLQKKSRFTAAFLFGAEMGIRTPEAGLPPTRFPIVLLRPARTFLHGQIIKLYDALLLYLNLKRKSIEKINFYCGLSYRLLFRSYPKAAPALLRRRDSDRGQNYPLQNLPEARPPQADSPKTA